jgi:hypothetical protein
MDRRRPRPRHFNETVRNFSLIDAALDVQFAWRGPTRLSRSAIPPAPPAAHASGAYINGSVSALSSCSALAVEEQPSQRGAERTAQNHPDRNYLENNPHFVVLDAVQRT